MAGGRMKARVIVNFFDARRGVALDVDVDVGVDVAAQPLDRLVQRHVHRRLVVDADDVILGLDADADGRRVGHRALDRDAVLLVHLDDDARGRRTCPGSGCACPCRSRRPAAPSADRACRACRSWRPSRSRPGAATLPSRAPAAGWAARSWKISCSLLRRLQGASTRSIEKLRCWPLTLTVTCLGSCSGQRSIRISGTSRWTKSSAPTSIRLGSRRFLSK